MLESYNELQKDRSRCAMNECGPSPAFLLINIAFVDKLERRNRAGRKRDVAPNSLIIKGPTMRLKNPFFAFRKKNSIK